MRCKYGSGWSVCIFEVAEDTGLPAGASWLITVETRRRQRMKEEFIIYDIIKMYIIYDIIYIYYTIYMTQMGIKTCSRVPF